MDSLKNRRTVWNWLDYQVLQRSSESTDQIRLSKMNFESTTGQLRSRVDHMLIWFRIPNDHWVVEWNFQKSSGVSWLSKQPEQSSDCLIENLRLSSPEVEWKLWKSSHSQTAHLQSSDCLNRSQTVQPGIPLRHTHTCSTTQTTIPEVRQSHPLPSWSIKYKITNRFAAFKEKFMGSRNQDGLKVKVN